MLSRVTSCEVHGGDRPFRGSPKELFLKKVELLEAEQKQLIDTMKRRTENTKEQSDIVAALIDQLMEASARMRLEVEQMT